MLPPLRGNTATAATATRNDGSSISSHSRSSAMASGKAGHRRTTRSWAASVSAPAAATRGAIVRSPSSADRRAGTVSITATLSVQPNSIQPSGDARPRPHRFEPPRPTRRLAGLWHRRSHEYRRRGGSARRHARLRDRRPWPGAVRRLYLGTGHSHARHSRYAVASEAALGRGQGFQGSAGRREASRPGALQAQVLLEAMSFCSSIDDEGASPRCAGVAIMLEQRFPANLLPSRREMREAVAAGMEGCCPGPTPRRHEPGRIRLMKRLQGRAGRTSRRRRNASSICS